MLGDAPGSRGLGAARERRAARVERDAVEPALGLVERAVDAGELLLGDDVGREPRLDLGEARVVGVLEGLEGAGELVEGGGHLGGLGLGSLEGSHVGSSAVNVQLRGGLCFARSPRRNLRAARRNHRGTERA